jgi:hypothetical protein
VAAAGRQEVREVNAFSRRRFLRIVGSAFAATIALPRLRPVDRALAAGGSDDWHSQKELATTPAQFSSWVDATVATLQKYRDELAKSKDMGQQIKDTIAAVDRALADLPATKVTALSDLATAKDFADRLLAPIDLIKLANALGAAGLILYLQLLALILALVVGALAGADAAKLPWDAMDDALDFIKKGLEHGTDKDKQAAKDVEAIKTLKDEAKKAIEKGKQATELLEKLKEALQKFIGGHQQ